MENKKILLAKMNPELVANQIGDFIIDEVTKINYTGAVIGLSGGVDSTTTAALAKRAFDKYNIERIENGKKNGHLELVGYMLPTKVNDQKDTSDGEKVANRLGIRYEVKTIDKVVDAFYNTNEEIFKADNHYDVGNLMSRIRANILSTKAAYEKKLLLGTGNRDEDFGVGYYTLFGDGAVHLSPIGNLPKRLVRDMARYLGFADLADRIPTAGLEPDQTDFKDLGYGYDLVELVSEGLLQGFTHKDLENNLQVRENAAKQIKDYQNLYQKNKFENETQMVRDIFKRNKIATAKSEIIHPPIAPVTLNYGVWQ